ncbi:MAG: choice-of-anchor tandem repeat GloVer-containing protein [Terriglobales bacterium]
MSVRLASARRFSTSFTQVCAIVCVAFFLVIPAWGGSRTKILYRPKPTQGAHFWGTMVFDSAGNLYGTTQQGGIIPCGPVQGCGTVFELSPQPDGTWTPQVLYQFKGGTDGDLVYSGVILDSVGNLYGTTAAGGANGYGTAYELSPGANGWTETLLHTFASQSGDGEYSVGPLTFDQSGNLYGTTYQGRTPCDYGTVYQLSPNPQGGWTENVLHCFDGSDSDGTYPSAGVIFDPAGNLYSTTFLGGPNGDGTVFELSPSGGSWTEDILYSFGQNGSGIYPYASLVRDKSGNLYGIFYGGVFELTPSGGGWTYSTIYEAQPGLHGVAPNSLIIDEAGNLLGTAEGGSSSNCHGGGCGAVFKLTHREKGWQMTVLHNFPGGAGGADPYGGLVMDQQGNLYGTTYDGGRKGCGGGCGVVFEISATQPE